MNKLFGFFKDKIVQANVENKKDLETLVNVLSGDDTGYKSQIIFSHLQKIKNNYMTWSILIANQASTGLYYSQLHNHAVCLKKANLDKDFQKTVEKCSITHQQMKKTHQELKEIGSLSQNWVQNVRENIEQIKQLRMEKIIQRRDKIKKTQKEIIQKTKELQTLKITSSKSLEEENTQEQIESSPIIVSEVSTPIISFSQQKTSNQIIIKLQKW